MRVLLLSSILLLVACQRLEGAASVAPDPPCRELRWSGVPHRGNVILVVSDTTRRDRLGIYGGPARTPVFDGFARRNLYFENASSQAPWTKPAVATLLTGLYPSQHGVRSHPNLRRGRTALKSDVLPASLVTLPEVLSAAGFQTAAVVSNPWLTEGLGFEQGFESYSDDFASRHAPGREVSEAALRWLDRRSNGRPFFLYLHYMDSHRPYPPIAEERLERRREVIEEDHRPLSSQARRDIGIMARLADGRPAKAAGLPVNLALIELAYDGGVKEFDAALGVLLDGLARREVLRDSAVLVLSDHGEALYRRGWGGHGSTLYDGQIAIPLAAQLPGVATRGAVSCPVGSIDVLPSLCVYLGLDCPQPIFGTSFLSPPRRKDGRSPRYLVSEGVIGKPEHRSIRNRDYKLIYQPYGGPGEERLGRSPDPWALFDLSEDPSETRDLLDEEPRDAEAEAAFEVLADRLRQGVPPVDAPTPEQVEIDDETRRRLEGLGYVDSPR